jgi:hypothetical protein
MSMVATRTPLTAIGMNGAGAGAPRRSARLSLEAQEDDERPGKRQKVDVKKPAAAAAENGTGKRTRGKGRISRSLRGCNVGNARIDADNWVQFTTTRMEISSLQSARNPARNLRPGIRTQKKRLVLRSLQQSQHHRPQIQKRKNLAPLQRRTMRQRHRGSRKRSCQRVQKIMLRQRQRADRNALSKKLNRPRHRELHAISLMPTLIAHRVPDSILSR